LNFWASAGKITGPREKRKTGQPSYASRASGPPDSGRHCQRLINGEAVRAVWGARSDDDPTAHSHRRRRRERGTGTAQVGGRRLTGGAAIVGEVLRWRCGRRRSSRNKRQVRGWLLASPPSAAASRAPVIKLSGYGGQSKRGGGRGG
jgi:hypothetical protein